MATAFVKRESTAGMQFVGSEEKAELIKEETPMEVVRVFRGPDSFNPGRERYVLIVKLDGEERAFGFGQGWDRDKNVPKPSSRDETLDDLIAHLELEDPAPVSVYLKIVGKNFCSVEVAE